jgi:hypothetical protein
MAEETNTDQTPERFPSGQELYLQELAEQRANEGKTPDTPEVVKAPYAVEGNETDAFTGVSPEYATYSGEFGKPYLAPEGPTVDLEEEAAASDLPLQVSGAVHPSEATSLVAEDYKPTVPATETPEAPPVPKLVPAAKEKSSADPAAPAVPKKN